MDVKTLQTRLAAVPRVALASFPTPLEPLQRLGRRVASNGPRLWVKRDDGIGPAMGGNKARKLEFLLAEAKARGATRVATFGGLQSNHARMTAAAARKLGLEPHLFFFEPRPRHMPGNLLLDDLLGARMHFVPLGGSGGMTLEATSRLVQVLSWLLAGPGTYFIPVGGHTRTGCLGYVVAAQEIHEQAAAMGLQEPVVVLAAGSGGTLAGLWAGLELLQSPVACLGIDVGKLWRGFPTSIAHMADTICSFLGEPGAMRRRSVASGRGLPAVDGVAVPLLEGTYVGPGYARPTPEGLAAIHLLAETEGILLDPVYTSKACAGLLDLLQQGRFAQGQDVIFLHTGGVAGLFAFADAFGFDRRPHSR